MILRVPLLVLITAACLQGQTLLHSQDNRPLTGGLAEPESDRPRVFARTILIRPKASLREISSRFFPSQDRLTRGTAAPIFLRMNWEATDRAKALRQLRDIGLWDKPLDEFDTRLVDSAFPINISEMTRAVFRERAGWEYPLDEEPVFQILLPDVGGSILYFHAMLLKARSLAKQGKLAEAEHMLCLVIGLAKHVGEAPFVVSRLVQKVRTNEALSVVEELVQHPNAPNYYWDLVSLPQPIIDVRSAIQLESAMLAESIVELNDLDSLKTQEQWEALARKIIESLSLWSHLTGSASLPKPGTPEAKQTIQDWVSLSRKRLPEVDPGVAPRIAEMSDAEVGVRYWWLRVQARTKSHLVLSLLEPEFGIPKVIADLKRLEVDAQDELPVRVGTPMAPRIIIESAMLEQKVVMLRAVESIRDHVARHADRLPASLADLELPVPKDPVSGVDLSYEVAAGGLTARLSGATIESPAGWPNVSGQLEKTIVQGMRYDLKLVGQ